MTLAPFSVLLVAATDAELAPLRAALAQQPPGYGHDAGVAFDYLVTGVGVVSTAAVLTEQLLLHRYDVVINIGLAGALSSELQLGDVVLVTSDDFGDIGAEGADGTHLSLFELGLAGADEPPYTAGRIVAPDFSAGSHKEGLGNWPASVPLAADQPAKGDTSWERARNESAESGPSSQEGLAHLGAVLADRFGESRRVGGTTVAQAHGTQARIDHFRSNNAAAVETMEGAAVFYVAFRQNLPSVQIRAISNYVEPRDRDAWQIGLAMERLTQSVLAVLTEVRERVRDAPASPPPPNQ